MLKARDLPTVPFMRMHDAHLEEVAMINEICELIATVRAGREQAELIGPRLEQLFSHTHNHFAAEERMMRDAAFPPYMIHRQAHDRFLSEMRQAIDRWRSDDAGLADLEHFMRRRLPAWMKDHIATMDYVTAGFLASRIDDS